MTFEEIAERVQREFGDSDEIQITTDDILRWANDAQLEIARKTECLIRDQPEFLSISGEEVYDLSSDFLKVRDVYYDGSKLEKISLNALDLFGSDRKQTNPALAQPVWFRVRNSQVFLYPIPDASGKSIKIEYAARPSPIAGTGSEPEIPEQYHLQIVTYCLARAYALDSNFNASTARQGEFETKTNQFMSDANWPYSDTYPLIDSPSEY